VQDEVTATVRLGTLIVATPVRIHIQPPEEKNARAFTETPERRLRSGGGKKGKGGPHRGGGGGGGGGGWGGFVGVETRDVFFWGAHSPYQTPGLLPRQSHFAKLPAFPSSL